MRRKTQWRPTVVRIIGTPQLRWENWSQMAMDREAWNRNIDRFIC